MNNNEFFKKDPHEKEDKVKPEDHFKDVEYIDNADDADVHKEAIIDYTEVNSSLPEDGEGDLFGEDIVSNSEIQKESDSMARDASYQEKQAEDDKEKDLKELVSQEDAVADLEQDNEVKDESEEKAKSEEDDYNPENKGEILKRERLKKGLSLELVHEVTKVPMDVLRAIEEGYSVRNLTTFYLNGFIKIYAKYLEVDVSRIIEGYQKKNIIPAHIKYVEDEPEIKKWISKFFTRKKKQQIVLGLGLLLSLFIVFKIAAFFAGLKPKGSKLGSKTVSGELKKDTSKKKKITVRKPESVKKEKKTVKKEAVKKKAPVVKKTVEKKVEPKKKQVKNIVKTSASKPPVVSPSQTVVKKAVTASAEVVAFKKNVTLTVRAKKNSWLSVKVDGNVVFQSTLRLGSVETWMADEKIEISGKNINQLDFELNGKMIGTLGRKDRKAKRLVVTKDGLTVTE